MQTFKESIPTLQQIVDGYSLCSRSTDLALLRTIDQREEEWIEKILLRNADAEALIAALENPNSWSAALVPSWLRIRLNEVFTYGSSCIAPLFKNPSLTEEFLYSAIFRTTIFKDLDKQNYSLLFNTLMVTHQDKVARAIRKSFDGSKGFDPEEDPYFNGEAAIPQWRLLSDVPVTQATIDLIAKTIYRIYPPPSGLISSGLIGESTFELSAEAILERWTVVAEEFGNDTAPIREAISRSLNEFCFWGVIEKRQRTEEIIAFFSSQTEDAITDIAFLTEWFSKWSFGVAALRGLLRNPLIYSPHMTKEGALLYALVEKQATPEKEILWEDLKKGHTKALELGWANEDLNWWWDYLDAQRRKNSSLHFLERPDQSLPYPISAINDSHDGRVGIDMQRDRPTSQNNTARIQLEHQANQEIILKKLQRPLWVIVALLIVLIFSMN